MNYFIEMGQWVRDTWLELWRTMSTTFRKPQFWRYLVISYVFTTIILALTAR